MLVAATARAPEAESRDPMLVAQLIAEPELVAIRPEPLGRESIAVLAQKLHGLEPDEAFCAASRRRPAATHCSSARCSTRSHGRNQPDRRARAPSAADRRAGRFSRVGLRLARLPPAALALLRAAAILGDGAELRHAAALAGVEAGELGPAAAALVRLDLLRREDPLEFFHPVVRRAVYETLDVVERGAAHRSAAELLLEAGAPPRVRPGTFSGLFPSGRVRGLDAPPGGRARPRPGRGRGRGRLSDPRARGAA